MPTLKVALLQMTAFGFDQRANLQKGEAFCRLARHMGADIALFPEMWNIGYTFFDPSQPDAEQSWKAQAIQRESPFVEHFRVLARELDMAILITYLESWPGAPRNSLSLIDRHGEIQFTYAKVHTCDFDKEIHLTRGQEFFICSLDTSQGPVDIGAMICYDREFPESARILMLKGAEIILTPNACTLEPHRIGQFRTRAFENMLGVAMANYAAPQNNGHSVAFDGVAFSEDGQYLDNLLVKAGESEGLYLADFDLDRLRRYRQREIWGNAFRRQDCYRDLTSPEIAPLFQRVTARR